MQPPPATTATTAGTSAARSATNSGDTAARPDLFVARQPIFDRQREVMGYELLFRSGMKNAFAHTDGSQATRQAVSTTMNVMGLSQLVGSSRAFVNVTRELLLNEFYHVLPPEQTVVELLEDIAIDDDVVAACQQLKAAGYTLALDDFVFQADSPRLLEIADIVKVDLTLTSMAESRALIERYGRPGLSFLAEKVETAEQYEQAIRLGYRYFQGYFFCKPEILSDRDVPAGKQQLLLLVSELTRPVLDYGKVEQAIRLDPSLSVKLLRYINASAHGLKETVGSIHQALTLLGEKTLRQWCTLVAMTCLGEDKPAELVRLCLARARFCELLGEHMDLDQSQFDLFLMGLLSMLDALLDRPMAAVLPALPVADAIKSALLGDASPLAKLHMLAVARERGDWARLDVLMKVLRLDPATVAMCDARAVAWADQAVATTRAA